jgi:hypothetical protein
MALRRRMALLHKAVSVPEGEVQEIDRIVNAQNQPT